jgi:hypothetical protein
VQQLVDHVLIGLEDRHLDDLVVLDAIDVGAPDLDRAAGAVEALANEQHDALVAGEHVDELDLDRVVGIARADGLDVLDGGLLAEPPAKAERPGMWRIRSSARKPNAVSQSARLAAAR